MHADELTTLKETNSKGDFMLPFVAVNTIMPDFYTTYPMHWHDEMEIIIVDSGEFEEEIDLEKYYVREGDIVIINPCTLHSFRVPEGQRTRFRSVIFNMSMLINNNTDACAIKYFTPFLDGMYLNPVVISSGSPAHDELVGCVENLIEIYHTKPPFYEITLKSELYDLFRVLFTHYFVPEEKEPAIKDTTTRNIKIILDYVAENYMNPITIDELADSVNLSKHYFMRFFKKYMGTTCIEYINDYRLNVATNLLLTTGLQITEISSRIGISNLSYFNRIFKKKYNMTPKEYRFNVDNRS